MAADGEEDNATTAGTEESEKEDRSKGGGQMEQHGERQMERDSGTDETSEWALHGFW